MNRFITIISSICFLFFSTGVSSAGTESGADKIYINAEIWTGEEKQPVVNALAVRGSRILALGSYIEMKKYIQPSTKIIDLKSAFMVPGFIDSHVHFLAGGTDFASVKLRSATSPREFVRRMTDHVKSIPKGRWVLGGNWDHTGWGGELPHKDWIDEVTLDNPVFVRRLDGHMVLANSLALKLAGITRDTVAPKGGVIVRDKNGDPTGVLKDQAINLVANIIPTFQPKEMDEAFQAASELALKNGITQIHDMGMDEGQDAVWNSLNVYLRAQKKHNLKLRIYSFIPLNYWKQLDKFVQKNGYGNEWLRWGGLKGFLDGSLGSATAWFKEPYLGNTENSGFPVISTKKLHDMILGADAAKLHVAVHAIGDQANDTLLDIFESVENKNGRRDRRFRVEHSQHLSQEAFSRFQALNVVPSMQPYHAIDDGRWAEELIGPDRITRTYAFRSLIDAEAPLSFGSDWFVAPLSPLQGIYAAVTRRTIDGNNPGGWVPHEKISVEEALRAYTTNNAYAGFNESDTGTLKAGKLADFTVLSKNILLIDPSEIANVKVLRTVVGGIDQFVITE
ncbi:amidohydrolase [Paremcibacter congregatus]|uniref:Amidohydrolase n=1 Tax=Paremcibacter congregatus TaxID=2043170 RepID=A0A2G4YVK0_9PROT|nr:amidohydrolase [Paremcibacter congregatus]PHZ86384.1 amidohydrolase [Paremcibacter congregatus]QDE28519.1 amidohydrolase [Paremcibacter congregatus]